MSPTRRNLFIAGGVVVLAAAGASSSSTATDFPQRLSLYRPAEPGATVQPGAPATPDAPAADFRAELAKPGPDGDMALGSDKAPVTVIEYASMTCPHCAHFSETTFPELKKRYIDTGKVRYIFREFPFDKLAAAGFMLARCASKDGGSEKYMAVVETLFAKQNEWVVTDNPVAPLSNIAKQLGFTDEFVQSLPDRSEGPQRHRGGAQPRGREARRQFHADFLRQRQEGRGRRAHRDLGQGNRSVSQDRLGLLRPRPAARAC